MARLLDQAAKQLVSRLYAVDELASQLLAHGAQLTGVVPGKQHGRIIPQHAGHGETMAISPKPLYCWQQAPLVAEVGSEEVAYAPEVYALRAHLKHAEQEIDILKKPWSPNTMASKA